MKTEITQVYDPQQGRYRWQVAWMSPAMLAPAFDYFDSEGDAEAAAERLNDGIRADARGIEEYLELSEGGGE